MAEDIEEEVIFKGSALYAHLASLQLTEEGEEQHPLLPSLQTAGTGHSPVAAAGFDTRHIPEKKLSLCQRLYDWSWRHVESLTDRFFQTKEREERLLWNLATLLCSRGLLTQDDRLHLYYFSPVFSQLVEEPSLAAAYQQPTNTSTWPVTVSRPMVLGSTLAVVTTIAVTACWGEWDTLTISRASNLHLRLWSAALYSFLVPGLLAATAIYCRTWHWRRYDRCFTGLERVLGSLASLQHSCLPQAFAAAADAGLLTGPHDSGSEAALTPLVRRVRQELLHLQQLLHSTLQCALQLIGGPGADGRPKGEGPEHTWSSTKASRRELESLVSAYTRDILLQAERAFSKNSSQLNGSPWAPTGVFTPKIESSVFSVITEAYVPLSEQLPQLKSYSSMLTSQVKLLRHCWLYSADETRPREVQTEEQAAADTLTRHLQAGLRQVEQARVVLLTLSDSSVQVESANPEQETLNGTLSACKANSCQSRDVDGDSLTAFEETYQRMCSQLKELRATVDLCVNDVTVLEESVAWRRLRLLQQLGRSETVIQRPTSGSDLLADDEETVSKPGAHGDAVELVPYVAEDEVFEASTETAEDEALATSSSNDWLADAEEDQQRKRLRACGRRLLAELQPILDTKKKEFQEREKRAWRRMKGGHEDDEQLEDETKQPSNEASVTRSGHDDRTTSKSLSLPSPRCAGNSRSRNPGENNPSTIGTTGDTDSSLTKIINDITGHTNIDVVKNNYSSCDRGENVNVGLKKNNVVRGENGGDPVSCSRLEAIGKETQYRVVPEPSDKSCKVGNDACSNHDDQRFANNHLGSLDKFWYFLQPATSAPEGTALVDVFGVGRTPSADRPVLLPLFRVPLARLPSLKQSSLSLSDQIDAKLVQLENCESKGRMNGVSLNSVDCIAASVAVDAPAVMVYESSPILQFMSDNHSRLPLITSEEDADCETVRVRQSFLHACDDSCCKMAQILTKTWPLLHQVSSEIKSEPFHVSLSDETSTYQSDLGRPNLEQSVTEDFNPLVNELNPFANSVLNLPLSKGDTNEHPRPIEAAEKCHSGSDTIGLQPTPSACHEYTSYCGDSCDDVIAASTLEEDHPTTPPVAQVFTSDPSTDDGDPMRQGDSSWNIEEKPVDLQGRLKLLLHSHMQERGVEGDVESGEGEDYDGRGSIGLGFHSQLALQAVQLSSKFGIGREREEMFGGVGQNETVFGDTSSEEEGDGTDCSGEGEEWVQTEM